MVCVYLPVVACAYHVACVVGGLGPVPFYEVQVEWGSASTHVTRYNLLLLAREESCVSEGEVMYAYEHTYVGGHVVATTEPGASQSWFHAPSPSFEITAST